MQVFISPPDAANRSSASSARCNFDVITARLKSRIRCRRRRSGTRVLRARTLGGETGRAACRRLAAAAPRRHRHERPVILFATEWGSAALQRHHPNFGLLAESPPITTKTGRSLTHRAPCASSRPMGIHHSNSRHLACYRHGGWLTVRSHRLSHLPPSHAR